ncbi:hypothetical protein G6F24_014385 [Rhizopus arrhizus]|nr:hypothetical protein G6F24_014385 [Rhizopus arrhizus]
MQAVDHREHAADRALHVFDPACGLRLRRHPVHAGTCRLQAALRIGQHRMCIHLARMGLERGVQLQHGGVDLPPHHGQLHGQPRLLGAVVRARAQQAVGRATFGGDQVGQIKRLPQLAQADQIVLGGGIAHRPLAQGDDHQRQGADHEQPRQDPDPGPQPDGRYLAGHSTFP